MPAMGVMAGTQLVNHRDDKRTKNSLVNELISDGCEIGFNFRFPGIFGIA